MGQREGQIQGASSWERGKYIAARVLCRAPPERKPRRSGKQHPAPFFMTAAETIKTFMKTSPVEGSPRHRGRCCLKCGVWLDEDLGDEFAFDVGEAALDAVVLEAELLVIEA